MALPGSKLNDIKEVASHPMALLQCKKFFKLHPNIKLIEESDTAAVAKRISDDKIKSSEQSHHMNAQKFINLT